MNDQHEDHSHSQQAAITSLHNSKPNINDTILSILWDRSIGRKRGRTVYNRIRQRGDLTLFHDYQICAPHSKAISSLHMDKTEARFLLAGSKDATVSIYDLTKWGRQLDHNNRTNLYKPVAQSLRSPVNSHGHATSIVRAEWYPFDTGAFVSASTDGTLLVWDTQAMQSVVHWHPFPDSALSCLATSTSEGRSESLVAIGSQNEAMLKLLDLRSGAAMHSLVGHTRGITSVAWSPVSDVVLASGSLDGTIRLWDIRQAGSRACLMTLDRDETSPYPLKPCQADYRHLRRRTKTVGPNTYANDQNHVMSHSGPVTAVSFTHNGRYLMSCGAAASKKQQQLQMWDLSSRGNLMTRQFAGLLRPPLLVMDDNDDKCVVASGNTICSYAMSGGGPPTQVLEGHLGRVTALESFLQLVISGGEDGMILAWGPKSWQQRQHLS